MSNFVLSFLISFIIMQRSDCLGCQRSFQEGYRLPLEDLVIELKNYTFPIRDQKHRWILLKTIVSLLNSKGGTIFIGAEDKTGEVLGISISRKQQDQFKLFIQKLVEKILPPVDLSYRQDIKMQFLPVTKNGSPTDRFIGKIIVKQGKTKNLYCFTQKVVMQTNNDKRYDQFEVVYSFKRINMGSVKQLQGYQVVAQAANRAMNPPKQIEIFHEGCNPDPIQMIPSLKSMDIPSKIQIDSDNSFAIQFFKVKNLEVRQKLEDQIEKYLEELKIKSYNMSYDVEKNLILVEFLKKEEWKETFQYIQDNIQDLNDSFGGIASFAKKVSENDFVIFENEKPELKKSPKGQVCEVKQQQEEHHHELSPRQLIPDRKYKEKPAEFLEKTPKLQHKSQSLEAEIQGKPSSQNHVEEEDQHPFQIKVISQNKEKKILYTKDKYVSLPSSINIEGTSILTITHLNPARKQQLKQYIQQLTKSKKKVDEYEKTFQFHLNKDEFNEVYDKLEKSKDLTKFGFRGFLRYGINTGQITFENYDKNKYKQFKDYITKTVGPEIKRCQFTKKGNKYTLLLTLKSTDKAAMWLDKLIQDQNIKSFRLPPSNQSSKMKIDLVCVKPTKLKKGSLKDQ